MHALKAIPAIPNNRCKSVNCFVEGKKYNQDHSRGSCGTCQTPFCKLQRLNNIQKCFLFKAVILTSIFGRGFLTLQKNKSSSRRDCTSEFFFSLSLFSWALYTCKYSQPSTGVSDSSRRNGQMHIPGLSFSFPVSRLGADVPYPTSCPDGKQLSSCAWNGACLRVAAGTVQRGKPQSAPQSQHSLLLPSIRFPRWMWWICFCGRVLTMTAGAISKGPWVSHTCLFFRFFFPFPPSLHPHFFSTVQLRHSLPVPLGKRS